MDGGVDVGEGEVFAAADGSYSITAPVAGDYKVEIAYQDSTQWIAGQTSPASATVFPVSGGATVTANDTMLPGGTVRLTVTDSASGQPVDNVCATLNDNYVPKKCGATDGVLEFDNVGNEANAIAVTSSDGLHANGSIGQLSVASGQTVDESIALAPTAAITATVLDSATQQPVHGVCVYALTPEFGTQDWSQDAQACPRGADLSDTNGTVTIGQLPAGTFTLLADPSDGVHGLQWVGPHGGTGSQAQAEPIDTQLGQSSSAGVIELDGQGSITGTLTDAGTGQLVAEGAACPSVLPFNTVVTTSGGGLCTDNTGTYTVYGLGPYQWPLQFADASTPYAWQWTGGGGDQTTATMIPVTANGTTTAYVSTGQYTITGVTNESVKVGYQVPGGPLEWLGGNDFDSAQPVQVAAGQQVSGVDLVVDPSTN